MNSELLAGRSAETNLVHGVIRLIALTAAICWTASAIGQGVTGKPGMKYDLSISAIHQPETETDGGGEFALSGGIVQFGLKRSLGAGNSVGLGFSYELDDYDFTEVTDFGDRDPWDKVRRFGISLPYFKILDNDWAMSLSPSVNWLQENGANSADSLSYGLTGFVAKSISRNQSVGLGAGIFRTIDENTDVFPFLALDWRFNERWRLSNPFDADALGPAGLELSYRFNDRWQLGGGGVYRSFRFRLDNEGVAPGGVGENKAVIAFLRLRWLSPSGLNLDFYAGSAVTGELKLEDAQGAEIASSDYESAALAAITFSLEF